MKKFKTLIEQKEHLVKNKNLNDEELIIDVLYERPYASIINPYKKFLYTSMDGDIHNYGEKVSIMDFYKLATFDDLVARDLYYKIGVFERRIKGAIAYVISEKMMFLGDDTSTMYVDIFQNLVTNLQGLLSLGFNDYKSFYNRKEKKLVEANDKTQEYQKKLLQNIADINDDKKKRNNLFQKYIIDGKKIPFWLVVHTLSLGELLSLFQMLTKEIKNDILSFLSKGIGKQIYSDSIFKFEDDLQIVKDLRNVINHYEPLYEFLRSKPKKKILLAINRINVYSGKVRDFTFDELSTTLPMFKNKDNDNVVDIYCQIIVKKRDD